MVGRYAGALSVGTSGRAICLCLLATAACLLTVDAVPASAAQEHFFEGTFGSTAQPSFAEPAGIAVDPATGDILVIDGQVLKRYKPNGEPDGFSALAGETNVIDGAPGDADATPQGNILTTEGFPAYEAQVAVAPPTAAAGTAGTIYVTNAFEGVVDVFAPNGKYLQQIAYTYPCGVGVAPNGDVYVGDFEEGAVHKLTPAGSSSPPPFTFTETGSFSTTTPCNVAAGAGPSSGFVFATEYEGAVAKIDSEGAEQGQTKYTVDPGENSSVAVDSATGHVFTIESELSSEVDEYDASGGSGPVGIEPPIEASGNVQGVGINDATGDIYLSVAGSVHLEVWGTRPAPPQIKAEWAAAVGLGDATLKAEFPPEEEETTYHVEYMTDAEFQANGGGFEGPNAPRVAPVPDAEVGTASVVSVHVGGLQSGTAYRYRFVATNSTATTVGAARLFTTTPPVPAQESNCPNQTFRTGASAFLPDCRAFEMVTPEGKNGANVVTDTSGASDPGGYFQVDGSGGKVTYTLIAGSFGDQQSNIKFDQYLAERQAGIGWINRGIQPPVSGEPAVPEQFGAHRMFMAFSADLCSAWVRDNQNPALAPDAQQGTENLYRRTNCGPNEGVLEAVTTTSPSIPPVPTATGYLGTQGAPVEAVQGLSEDSRHAVYIARAQLTEDAAAGSNSQVYDRFDGVNQLVSVLPGGTASPGSNYIGSGYARRVQRAVSANGTHIYWTTNPSTAEEGPGTLYLRLQPGGSCSSAAPPCSTEQVSPGSSAFFWAASSDGSRALYTEGTNLYEFVLDSPVRRLVAQGVKGVAGTSDDLSRIYFVSTQAIGAEGESGQPNLFLDEKGDTTLIATLAAGDSETAGGKALAYSIGWSNTYLEPSRVTPSGNGIVFESRGQLVGFDNIDARNGSPDVEVYLYRVGAGLLCVSCNPSGVRPQGAELGEPYVSEFNPHPHPTLVSAAAWIPTWEHPLHASHVISDDATRVFFNSNDPLLPDDANGAQDVYEWEAAGVGSCAEGGPQYFVGNGGCLYLISSGASPKQSEFREATPSGSDVFFTTESSLLPQDTGLIDLYDARVEGGFPQPREGASCDGEACQGSAAPPASVAPASADFQGPGNLAPHSRCRALAHRARGFALRAKRVLHQAGHTAGVRRAHLRGDARRLEKRARKTSEQAKRCMRGNRRAGR